MEPLKTLKGTKIWYSSLGVGKQVGNKIYMHKNYALSVVPYKTYIKALDLLQKMSDFENNKLVFNCICYDLKKPNIVRFDTCQNFDTEREPVVGWQYTVDIENKIISIRYCKEIWHHKWLWCRENYKGFDIQKSWEWSRTWLEKLNEIASGYPEKWNKQLEKVNLK